MNPKHTHTDSANDFDKKCHYTRQIFTCTHNSWLRKPCIVHVCKQRVTSKSRCANMAVSPLEVHVNEVCRNCKQQGRGAVNLIKISGKAGLSESRQDRKVVKAAGPSTEKAKDKYEAIKERDAGEEVYWFKDPKQLESNNRAESKAKRQVKQSESKVAELAADTKEQREKSNTTTLKGKAPIVRVPVVDDSVSKPKRTLAGEGRVRVKEERDWDIIPLDKAKDPDIDEKRDMKEAPKGKKSCANLSKPKIGESLVDDDEYPDWKMVAADEGEYLQGVDGWDMNKDERNKCRVN